MTAVTAWQEINYWLPESAGRWVPFEPLTENFNPEQPREPDGRFVGAFAASGEDRARGKAHAAAARIAAEKRTPPDGKSKGSYTPDVEGDKNGDGVADAARIGVPGMSVPPPPNVGKLPNLTPEERKAESAFIGHYQSDPDGVAANFLSLVKARVGGGPPTFGTDDAKELSGPWQNPTLAKRLENRATLNCALHQAANAIAKKAFLQHLDTLKAGDGVLVTVGGCGCGKGYSLKQVPEALAMKESSKAVWDSAGDQNATENPWIQKECEKRGLVATYVHVHADPNVQWAHPGMGVVKRAQDPKDGRMVDAQVFADSYALGARNHQAFHEANKDNPSAKFVFLASGKRTEGIPKEALSMDRKKLASDALAYLQSSDAPDHIKRGGSVGVRIWGSPIK